MTQKLVATYSRLFAIGGVVFGLDQLTKTVVRSNVGLGLVYRPELWLSRFIRIVHVKNYGAAGGILPELSGLFTVIPILAALGIVWFYPRVRSLGREAEWGAALLLGGAMGNLADRLIQGYVTDFISIGALPVMNLADLSISLGSALLIAGAWREERLKAGASASAEKTNERPETVRNLDE